MDLSTLSQVDTTISAEYFPNCFPEKPLFLDFILVFLECTPASQQLLELSS